MTVFYIISVLFVILPSSSAFLAPLASLRKSRATAGGSASVGLQSCHERTTIMSLGAEDTETTPDRVVSMTEIEVGAVRLIRMEIYAHLISSIKQLQEQLMLNVPVATSGKKLQYQMPRTASSWTSLTTVPHKGSLWNMNKLRFSTSTSNI